MFLYTFTEVIFYYLFNILSYFSTLVMVSSHSLGRFYLYDYKMVNGRKQCYGQINYEMYEYFGR